MRPLPCSLTVNQPRFLPATLNPRWGGCPSTAVTSGSARQIAVTRSRRAASSTAASCSGRRFADEGCPAISRSFVTVRQLRIVPTASLFLARSPASLLRPTPPGQEEVQLLARPRSPPPARTRRGPARAASPRLPSPRTRRGRAWRPRHGGGTGCHRRPCAAGERADHHRRPHATELGDRRRQLLRDLGCASPTCGARGCRSGCRWPRRRSRGPRPPAAGRPSAGVVLPPTFTPRSSATITVMAAPGDGPSRRAPRWPASGLGRRTGASPSSSRSSRHCSLVPLRKKRDGSRHWSGADPGTVTSDLRRACCSRVAASTSVGHNASGDVDVEPVGQASASAPGGRASSSS